jgi:glycyl-tRNA synthetase alpha subunit
MTTTSGPRTFVTVNPLFARPGEATVAPKYELGDGQMLPETAYQAVHDEAMSTPRARTQPISRRPRTTRYGRTGCGHAGYGHGSRPSR